MDNDIDDAMCTVGLWMVLALSAGVGGYFFGTLLRMVWGWLS